MAGPDLSKLLAPFARIRMGAGVIGKTSYVVLAATLICGVAIWQLSGFMWAILGVVAAMILFVGCFLFAAFKYAYKHPEHAVLEGADLVNYRRIEMKAKGMIDITPSANTSPPTTITLRSGEDGK